MGKAKPKLTPAEKAKRRSHTLKHIKKYSALYAMMILPVLYFIIFKYVPMVGNILPSGATVPVKACSAPSGLCATLNAS